jgi:hypothetical protein
MPVKRTQLLRAQKAMYLERARELQAAGLDCEVPDEWQENSRSLDIFVGLPQDNILYELSTGVTACAIWVELVALISNLILEENFRIASVWDSEFIACCNTRGLYGVGGAFELTEDEALNHRFENGLHFHHRGDVAKGWLCASGLRPIPKKYRDRMTTELRLTFTDQFGHDHSELAKATLMRSACLMGSDSRVQRASRPFEVVRPETENQGFVKRLDV